MAEASNIDFSGIKCLDDQIEVLLSCKPLPESEIKILCDKVSDHIYLHALAHESVLWLC